VDLPPEVFEEREIGGLLGREAKAMRLLLEKHRWNKSRAAIEYGVSRPTFLKTLKRLGLQ
jgi:transcriptional regulator of acetoin/glycerol metabolism